MRELRISPEPEGAQISQAEAEIFLIARTKFENDYPGLSLAPAPAAQGDGRYDSRALLVKVQKIEE